MEFFFKMELVLLLHMLLPWSVWSVHRILDRLFHITTQRLIRETYLCVVPDRSGRVEFHLPILPALRHSLIHNMYVLLAGWDPKNLTYPCHTYTPRQRLDSTASTSVPPSPAICPIPPIQTQCQASEEWNYQVIIHDMKLIKLRQ